MNSGLSLSYSNSLSVTCSQYGRPSLPHRHLYVSVSGGTCKMGAPRQQVSLLSSTLQHPALYIWQAFNTRYLFIYFYYYS